MTISLSNWQEAKEKIREELRKFSIETTYGPGSRLVKVLEELTAWVDRLITNAEGAQP